MGEIPTQHLEVMAESFRHDGLDGHHAVIRATLDGIADLRAALRDAEKAREAWTETARIHAKNEAYYRDLIVRTLSGTPAAFVSDDGSVQQDVICAKLPELYAASEKAREEAEKERDEAREACRDEAWKARRAEERAASLSRELLTAIQARDSYQASAELRVGMRREFEELLNVGDTMAPETFEAGLVRLRALRAAEAKAERLAKALREIDEMRPEVRDDTLPDHPADCPECLRLKDHPVYHGLCDARWRDLGALRERRDNAESAMQYRMKSIARATLAEVGE